MKKFSIFVNIILNAMITAKDIEECLISLKNEAQRDHLKRFFKTGKGEYGEGDEFLGLTVPQTRQVVREAKGAVSLVEIEKLLYSKWHESRLAGFLLLAEEMRLALPRKKDFIKNVEKAIRRKEISDFYLRHARQANNWDLVDMSCPKILGYFLLYQTEKDYSILYELSGNDNLWQQRIAMVTNWMLIRYGIFQPALEIADRLLSHPHDLIHKATGWMLREVGKRENEILENYLEKNYSKMSRTTLRYAIEKLSAPKREYWLKKR